MELLNSISALFKQISNEPACLLVIVGINVIIFAWETIPLLPSRFIILVSIVLGAASYPLFAAKSSVPYDVPYPMAVLVVNGLFSGLLAFAIHAGFITVLRKFTGWPPEAQKPNAQPTEQHEKNNNSSNTSNQPEP